MRPTVSLAMIVKNEAHNLPRIFKSIENCFDEIIIVDTGSTDTTKLVALHHGAKVYDFPWVNDFSKARNFAFSKVTSDFVYWQDGDDVLDSKESFIQWRDYAMEHADYWLAPYHYTLDANGKALCTFVRERVLKMSIKPEWTYFVHEGVELKPGLRSEQVHTWSVKHLRTADDAKNDHGRNLKLLESNRGKAILAPGLDTRMQWYLGKEFFDNQKFDQALQILVDVIVKDDLQFHDRILALQFAAYSAMALAQQLKPEFAEGKITLARQLGQQGLNLDPKRAEFYCLIGESYLLQNDLLSALPYFAAAENCITPEKMGVKSMSPIFTFATCYEDTPLIQKAKIFMAMGRIEEAEAEAVKCLKLYGQGKDLLAEIQKVKPIVQMNGVKNKTTDIVFSCPPHAAYPFDEEIYKQKGLGGSETALVQMARLLKEKTGRRVIVFNVREHDLTASSGVEYISNRQLNEYMSQNEPAVHIAWRHNIKVTNAPTYLWCHDLVCPTVELGQNFDKILCLSEFHKNYVMARQGVPESKIIVTRNGIPTENFTTNHWVKDRNKLVWLSSPDRGLVNCIPVLDMVRETYPDIRLEVFYGFDNLYKFGLSALADQIKEMMKTRPWIIEKGFMEQKQMHKQCADAVIWPHTADFIETFAISAIEALANGIYPVTRRLGALADTLKLAEAQGMATLLDHDAVTERERRAYADSIVDVLDKKSWERVSIELDKFSWGSIADEWISIMKMEDECFSTARPQSMAKLS